MERKSVVSSGFSYCNLMFVSERSSQTMNISRILSVTTLTIWLKHLGSDPDREREVFRDDGSQSFLSQGPFWNTQTSSIHPHTQRLSWFHWSVSGWWAHVSRRCIFWHTPCPSSLLFMPPIFPISFVAYGGNCKKKKVLHFQFNFIQNHISNEKRIWLTS